MWARGLIPLRARSSWVASHCQLSVTAQKETADIDSFLHSINSSPPATNPKNNKVIETAVEFCSWLDQHPVNCIDQFITAAQLAVTVKSTEQKEVFSKIDNVASSVLPTFYEKFGVKETVDSLRFVLQLSPRSKVSDDIQKLFIEKKISASDLDNVPFDTLVRIIRYSNDSVEKKVLATIADAVSSRMERELNNPADLMALLAGDSRLNSRWLRNKEFITKADKLVPVMRQSEKCAILKYMALDRQRNRQLLGALTNSICYSGQCLTVSQLVTVTNSCHLLTYFPPKLSKKVSEDLLKNSNALNNWSDVLSIADSLVKMRIGEQKSWNLIVRWAIENVKQAKVEQLSRIVSALTIIGEPAGKPLAKALKPHLKLTKAKTPTAWLNQIYSMAYFQELEEVHADSVLNKSFVDQIMSSSTIEEDQVRKAMRLLMINAAAKVDLKGAYNGPTVDKETFARFGIKFDAHTIQNASHLKYSKSLKDCEDIFFKSLFKLAPRDTHCRSSNIEDCGAFVDAYVMPAHNTALLVNTNQWGSNKPRPIFYYGWMQTKKNMDMDGEQVIIGQEQLALRLMRATGYDPIVVTEAELVYCATDTDKVNLLREKIHRRS